jgi:hypothetical protein
MPPIKKGGQCNPACTDVIKFYTNQDIPANTGISQPPYNSVDGYRYINIFVEFTQEKHDEPPVSLGVIFSFDENGTMGARRYVNLEDNVPAPQPTNMISVSGEGTWHGSPHNKSTYVVRLPVMGPFVEVFPFNHAPKSRKVSVWGYLVS